MVLQMDSLRTTLTKPGLALQECLNQVGTPQRDMVLSKLGEVPEHMQHRQSPTGMQGR